MAFLRNSWYCAGWSSELTDKPLGRRMLGDYLVLYRGQGGQIIASSGRCPHRFAPLDGGVVVGDTIGCPYHGLRFGADGSCVHNPVGDGFIPPQTRLRSYPAVERGGAIWVWMGEPERADLGKLSASDILDDPALSVRTAYLNIAANYQLVIDNLLDLSHAPFLHAATLASSSAEDIGAVTFDVSIAGDAISATYHNPNQGRSPKMASLFPHPRGAFTAKVTWRPASIVELDVRMAPLDGGGKGLRQPTLHYLTPETDFSTHYFAAMGRDVKIDDPEEDRLMVDFTMRAFTQEDEPMIVACQQQIGPITDIFELHPVVLRGDAAAVQTRRLLAKMIREDQMRADAAP
jgi:vanillate O-demethylase monooxygenase subunit